MNISLSTKQNREIFDGILCKSRNFDILKREIVFAGRKAVLYMIVGSEMCIRDRPCSYSVQQPEHGKGRG